MNAYTHIYPYNYTVPVVFFHTGGPVFMLQSQCDIMCQIFAIYLLQKNCHRYIYFEPVMCLYRNNGCIFPFSFTEQFATVS